MILRTELADLLTDVLAVVIATDDAAGTIVYATRPAEVMFGHEARNALVGRCVDELVPADTREKHRGQRAEYSAHPRLRPMGQTSVLQGRRRDGSVFPVMVLLVPAVFDGQGCVAAIVVDLSALPVAAVDGGQH